MENELNVANDNFVIYLPMQSNNDNHVNVSLIFRDNKDIIQSLQHDNCVIVIKDKPNDNVQDIIQQAFSLLQEQGKVLNRKIQVVVMDQNDRSKMQKFVNNEQFEFVEVSSQQIVGNVNDVSGSKEEKKEEAPFEKFWKANIIQKMDNGILKTYIHRKGDSHSTDYMLEDIKLTDLYEEFKKLVANEQFSVEIRGLKEEEIANKLLDSIALARNLKKYYLESANEIREDSVTARENSVINLAASNDGVANKEIGVVSQSANNYPYKTVEEDGNSLRVGSPNVTSNAGESAGDVSYDVTINDTNHVSYDNANADTLDASEANKDENVQEHEEQLHSRDMVRRRVRVIERQNSGFVSIVSYVIIAIVVVVIALFLGIVIFGR